MRRIHFFLLGTILFLFSNCSEGAGTQQNAFSNQADVKNGVVSICNWNIEWFGSTKKGPYDLDAQQSNTQKILQYIHADLFGLCEIVDVRRLDAIVKSLGSSYKYVVSDYCSNAKTINTQAYQEGQKMAFVYNTTVFKNVRVRGFMRKSKNAGYNFSNGRYPYLLEAEVPSKGKSQIVAVLLVHAKSGDDQDSYQRRAAAAAEMQDSIRTYLQEAVMIMGDFNDILQGSISGKNLSSSYAALMAVDYKPLTLPMEIQGQTSTIHYRNVIDNQVVNTLLANYFVKGSTQIRTDVINPVSDYKKGKTSDHYPVSSSFDFNQNVTAQSPTQTAPSTTRNIPSKTSATQSIKFLQVATPSFDDAIEITVSEKQENLQFVLYDASDNKVLSVHRRYIDPDKSFYLRCKELPAGSYTLVVFRNGDKQVETVVKK